MKKLILVLLFVLAVSGSAVGGMSNLNITYPKGERTIVFSYDLAPDDQGNTLPIFRVEISGEVEGRKKPLSPKRLSGDGEKGIIMGAGHKETVWDAGKDYKAYDTDTIKPTIKVTDISKEATYLCVDLNKYTLDFRNGAPDMTKKRCKTKELWLKRIEPGTFMMGSPTEIGRYSYETQHEVTISKAFYIGIFEVTQAQFKKIARFTTAKFKGPTRPEDRVSFRVLRGSNIGSKWPSSKKIDSEFVFKLVHHKEYYFEDGEWDYDEWDDPKYRNTFFENLRTKSGGLLFDLPTEAQWEYACRAGSTTSLNNGKDITAVDICQNLNELAWYSANSFLKKENATHPVGEKTPNAWGLYDMHGNVSELCLDWFSSDLGSYPSSDPVGATNGIYRVLKGGSWGSDAGHCRSAAKEQQYQGWNGYLDYDSEYITRYNGDCGFRIVLNQE